MRTRLLIALAALVATSWIPASARPQDTKAASDLDAFMKQVLSKRDDNWRKLQQYTLEEDEVFQITALNGRKVYGFEREYSWFPNDNGIFVRSPTKADGVKVPEEDRRKAEASWIAREEGRDKRIKERAAQNNSQNPTPNSQEPKGQDTAVTVKTDDDGTHVRVDSDEPLPGLNDLVKPGAEPRFVSSAYFMKFKFDEGSYAFVGREKLLGKDVYKIEYYPHQYFRDPPEKRAAKQQRRAAEAEKKGEKEAKQARKEDDLDDKIDRKMDKVSMITLWIEPKDHQILQYEFSNIDFDFLPGRALIQLDDLRAAMRMKEAFPNVWLPDTINMGFAMTIALGDINARYDVKYHDYKLAEVKSKLRLP